MSVPSHIEESRRKLAELDFTSPTNSEVIALRKRIKQLESKVEELTKENRGLLDACERNAGFALLGKAIRYRVLENAKEDYNERVHEYIRAGNDAAHRGQPAEDYKLAIERHAFSEWTKIYGIPYLDWPFWEATPELVGVLRYHGTLKCDDIPLSFSATFKAEFQKFSRLVEAEFQFRGKFVQDRNISKTLEKGALQTSMRALTVEYSRIIQANEKQRQFERVLIHEERKKKRRGTWTDEDEMAKREAREEWKIELERRSQLVKL